MTSEKLDYTLNIALDRPLDFIDKVQIYVVSLPGRQTRRTDMEKLRAALGLHWDYFDAIPSYNPLIGQISDWVELVRSASLSPLDSSDKSSSHPADNDNGDGDIADTPPFWPEHIDDIAHSVQEIALLSSSVWELPTSLPPYQSLTCNENNFDILDFKSSGDAPEHMRLTPARIACWHSHISVIHQHANTLPSASGKGSIALILEDDVDMERDIVAQMESLWAELPEDWDMVFLGHCWSDETRGGPVVQNPPSTGAARANTSFFGSRLYTSTSPKCTHAYAVSRTGARRLLLHMTHPPFAYSRAIDQAFAWLVESGRIKSFSVVPNLAMQRKVSVSDVMEGGTVNSQWKDTLADGVFSSLLEHPN
ncbi:hypothetical protein CVT25_007962 [Psilocybe cyanescens]|uniref:Glycosyl transferase family 25 domain-containing protein n=1 Tax=Psilocybe cyanescens TaxID=93625 RepID=A0A409XN20_PSICY|nr:hypothetical protein CVT25_007962 [Psilocybe cyanescens]